MVRVAADGGGFIPAEGRPAAGTPAEFPPEAVGVDVPAEPPEPDAEDEVVVTRSPVDADAFDVFVFPADDDDARLDVASSATPPDSSTTAWARWLVLGNEDVAVLVVPVLAALLAALLGAVCDGAAQRPDEELTDFCRTTVPRPVASVGSARKTALRRSTIPSSAVKTNDCAVFCAED